MSAQPIPFLTPEQYLEIDRGSQERHEYFDGRMWTMPGGTEQHWLVTGNLQAELHLRLKGHPFRVYSSGLRARTAADGLYTYPDVMVVCGAAEFGDSRQDTVTNPALIVEVLSPSTELYDRTFKFEQYKRIPSLKEYLLVSQKQPRVEVFRRMPGGAWGGFAFGGFEAVCTFESTDCAVPLTDIYSQATFEFQPEPE